MRAIVVDRWMEPRDLKVKEVPEPEVSPGTVGVQVKSAGCNFFDILLVRGEYQMKPPFPFVPGSEIAGVVYGVGEGVRDLAVGDKVFASVPLGAFTERVVMGDAGLFRMPAGMSFDEAAGFPIVYQTAYFALIIRTILRRGETLLVHAAAGGVGIAAVQIGKALGARVIATAGSAEKLEVARRAGADVAIDYGSEDWVARVKEETGGRGADVIYDPVGGDVFDGSMRCIAWSGRLLAIGFAGGRIPEVKVNRILLKNISVVGLHWGAYSMNEPEKIFEAYEGLFDLYEKGKIAPVIWKSYPLEEVATALEMLGSRRSWGKIVLRP